MEFIISTINLGIERYDFFLGLIVEHIVLTAISVLLIGLIGLSIGILMSLNDKLAKIMLGVISFLYTIPSIALFGILVSITGIGTRSAIVALVIYGLLPIIRNTYVGIKEVNPEIIEAAIGMGTPRKELLFRIQLPLALPIIFTGFRTMVIMTIALAGIAAFIGAGGLGVAIYRGIQTYFPEMIAMGSILVAMFAVLTDLLLERVERKIRRKVLGVEQKKEINYA
jgi:osmoprotectant transport system permease protein